VTIADDAKLEQLAVPRPKDLFPILDRTASLSPLLVLLTVLPGIIAFEFASIDEVDAQWRLKSLEVSTVSSVLEAVDPSGSSPHPALKWQPPLGSWIAAVARHCPWPIGNVGLELTEYLFAASLVPASFLLAARVLGRRIGFIAAALVAFHTTFLQQHQHAAPYGLAVSTALIAIWGFWGHMKHADDLVSIDLLIGGISLGLCLLSGGPLAFVVVVLVAQLAFVQWDPSAGARPRGPTRARRIWSGWLALRAAGVMVATAFAAGGWWELMMLYSYGSEFLTAWLWGVPGLEWSNSQTADPWLTPAFALRLVREFFATTRALSGLTLLGLFIVGRGLVPSAGGAARTGYRFLAVWLGCAFFLYAAVLRESIPGSLYAAMWQLFLMTACTACSAVAVDAVAKRQIGLTPFVIVTFAALIAGHFFLRGIGFEMIPIAWKLCGGVAFALTAALFLRRFCKSSDARQRLVLIGLVAAQVVADASIGIAAVRTGNIDSQSLRTFRHSLPLGIDAEACVLISDSTAPFRLQFALKSVWPGAQLDVVRDWDEALKIARGESQTPKTAVVVDWSQGNSRPANPTGAQWDAEPIGNPQFFEQRQLRAYVLVWERKGAADVNPSADPSAVIGSEKTPADERPGL